MRLAYLLNTYPLISTTFIRREIEALETLGQAVVRIAVRQSGTKLVDSDDVAEQRRTEYLLTGRPARLPLDLLIEALINLAGLSRALPVWYRLYRAAGGGLVRHLAYLMQAARFRQRAAELRIDHVHAHFSTNAAAVAMLAHTMGGPRYSFTVHGPDELLEPAKLALGEKMRRASFVVAITDFCRHRLELEAHESADRIRVIRCGLNLADYSLADMPMGLESQLVCVGRLCANKAQALIPAAIARVRNRFPDIRVEFVGDGEHRQDLLAEARRHGVEHHIKLAGWASADEVRDAIRRSSTLLLPSLAEGLPIVLMEALALGRPVLTTYVAGIPELVDKTCGWIFPSGSVDALADAMAAALATDHEDRIRLGREGRRRVEERHDIRHSARLLHDAMISAADHAPSAHPA